jgi:hypothetical protein
VKTIKKPLAWYYYIDKEDPMQKIRKNLNWFYDWVRGRIDGDAEAGMAKAVLETPRSEMADFELALGMFTADSHADLLRECLQVAGIRPWRRRMMEVRWKAIKGDLLVRSTIQANLSASEERAIDAAGDRIVDTQWVKEVPA